MRKDCKGICSDGVNKSKNVNYINGFRFCRPCNKYFMTDSFVCKCCTSRLRCKPANGKNREKLIELTIGERI